MKNTYYLVKHDRYCEFGDVIATFTNKKEAVKAKHSAERKQAAANGLRESEGSRERYDDGFVVLVNTADFEDVQGTPDFRRFIAKHEV